MLKTIKKDGDLGVFITFEGPEGAGKTTQIQLLRQFLESVKRDVVVTREPGGTEVAEQLRQIVKHHTGDEPITDETEVLLFAASRAQHVRNLILPSLERGAIVICDRFIDSTTAYQGHGRKQDLDFIKRLNNYAICSCVPDMTILLDLSTEEGFERTRLRQETLFVEDRIEAETMAFHHRVRDAYLGIAKEEPERMKIVAADTDPETAHAKIRELVNHAFGPF